jgi:glycosyltransferase involved in cell wall biosynthesis
VILLRDRRLFDGALPTKLFECLAAGRPVVVSARGEAAALVERTQTGIVVAPEDPSALAAAFRTLAADPELRRGAGERARTAATAFDRAGAVERWAELLQGARR